MIGLEFICKVFDIQYKEVAEKLGVSNQTITDWTKGKTTKIPEKRLNELVTKVPQFKFIDPEMFSRELTSFDKQRITNTYLVQDIRMQIEMKLKEPTIELLDEMSENLDAASVGNVIATNGISLLLVTEYLMDNENFMKELEDLIIRYRSK